MRKQYHSTFSQGMMMMCMCASGMASSENKQQQQFGTVRSQKLHEGIKQVSDNTQCDF